MTYDNESIRRRLMTTLILFEAILISMCMWAGWNIATAHGGSLVGAAPILLLAAAEITRIPLSGWATKLPWHGKILASIVLVAIAFGTAESLTLVFEQFVNNRVIAITDAQNRLEAAQAPYADQQRAHDDASAKKAAARDDVARLDALIATQMKAPPAMPALSGKTCGRGGLSTCAGDRQAQATYAAARKEYDASLASLRAERKAAQDRVDALPAVDIASATSAAVQAAKHDLLIELGSSPMHRLTAAIYGIPVEDVTPQLFAVVKKWAIIVLAIAFATMSMVISFVAHMAPVEQKESKLSRAIRMLLARKRKTIVAIREVPVEKIVEVVKEIPVPGPTKTVVKYLPANEQQRPDRRRGLGAYTMPNGTYLKNVGDV